MTIKKVFICKKVDTRPGLIFSGQDWVTKPNKSLKYQLFLYKKKALEWSRTSK